MTDSQPKRSKRFWIAAVVSVLLLLLGIAYGLVIYPLQRANYAAARLKALGFNIEYRQLIESKLFDKLIGMIGKEQGINVGALQLVSNEKSNFREADLANCHSFPRLTRLEVYNVPVTSQGLRQVTGMTNLTTLALTGQVANSDNNAPARTTIDLSPIGGLKALQSLALSRLPVGDEDLKHLTVLSDMEIVRLDGTKVTSPGVAHLTGLKKLAFISLAETAVGDNAIPHLEPLKSLWSIDLSDTKVTGRGIEKLKGCMLLTLQHNTLSNEGLESISRLPKLMRLDLSYSQVTRQGLEHLAATPNLCQILMHGPQFKDEHLRAIAKFKGSLALWLSGSGITSTGLMLLEQGPKVESIELSAYHVKQPQVIDSLRRMKYLKSLEIQVDRGQHFDKGELERQLHGRVQIIESSVEGNQSATGH